MVSEKDAELLIETDNIIAAAAAFKKLSYQDPDNAGFLLRLGYCYMNMPNDKEKAITILKKAEEIFRKEGKEVQAFDAKFLLARSYRKNLLYGDAILTFNELKIESKRKDYEAVEILDLQIKYCKNAKKMLDNDYVTIVRNLGKPINSIYSEHSPYIAKNGEMMIFTSKRDYEDDNQAVGKQYDEEIYIVNKEGDNWGLPKALGSNINTDENDASCGISPDGNTIYFFREGDIYKNDLNGDENSESEKLGNHVNTVLDEISFFITKDSSTIYFSSNQNGGYGGLDIYKCEKKDEGWGRPKNLGKKINTPFDDDSPFYHEDGTLYFSSKGHNSIGGYDIFLAKSSGKSFSDVKNMGVPVNSVEDDIHYYLNDEANKSYFTSSRKGGYGRSDIYFIDYNDTTLSFPAVTGRVVHEEEEHDEIIVNVYDIKTMKKFKTITADNTGQYRIMSKRGTDYFVHFESPQSFFEFISYPVPFNNIMQFQLSETKMSSLNKKYIHKKYPLTFKKDNKLTNTSKLFLNILAEFQNNNSQLRIDLHANPDENEKYSKKRISIIKKYLHEKNVSSEVVSIEKVPFGDETAQVVITIINENMEAFIDSGKSNGNTSGTSGEYTIQLGAFKTELDPDSEFFTKFTGYIVKIKDEDSDFYKYTYGSYSTQETAEDYALVMRKMGYEDAFVIKINK